MISMIRHQDPCEAYDTVKHAIAAELDKSSGWVLSRDEIDALVAQGAFTDPRQIPKDHAMTRVSVPPGRRYRVF